MPDLLTHLMVAQGCRKGASNAAVTVWFLVGTVLPDILTRPFIIVTNSSTVFWFVMPLHTPIGLLLVCACISFFVRPQHQRRIFYNLIGGAVLHLFLDMLQKHMGASYYLLFPFSWSSFEIGLVWPEDSLYLIPLWCAVGAVLVGRWWLRTKTSRL